MNLIVEFVSALKGAVTLTASRNLPGLDMKAGNLKLMRNKEVPLTTGMFITVGVSGKIEGRIIYRIDRLSALKLSGVMLGTTVRTMDAMAESALSELANIISGATLSSGNFNSLDVDMYPPTIFQGSVMTFNSLKMDIVHLPYTFTGGKLDVFIAIEDYNI